MLILLFIFALLRLLQGTTIATDSDTTSIYDSSLVPRDNSTTGHFGTRGVHDIIVSCLATIFACTWTAIHPNIPSPTDSGWVCFKGRVVTMTYALLAPEAITAWAMRQYFGARQIAWRYNTYVAKSQPPKYFLSERLINNVNQWFHGPPLPPPLEKDERIPWTITHGFFLQMGGFMLCENRRPIQTLLYRDWDDTKVNIRAAIENGFIDAPNITEAEIKDRSKGDNLSKTVVLLQTTWFIAQCIVRWSSNLPVTELEVVTLGFAMLNGLTYGLWWNKPQSIGVPVYLERKSKTNDSVNHRMTLSSTPKVETEDQTNNADHGTILLRSTQLSAPAEIFQQEASPFITTSWLRQKIGNDWKIHFGLQLCWRIPYRLVQVMLRPLSKLMDFSTTWVREGDLRVHIFYSYGGDDSIIFTASSIITMLFGAIHLVPAWFLDFPSHSELLLWRVSAFIITVQPLVLGLWAKSKHGGIYTADARSSPLGVLALIGLPFYFVARITLLVLAFLSLRSLSPHALLTISWISFIPHL